MMLTKNDVLDIFSKSKLSIKDEDIISIKGLDGGTYNFVYKIKTSKGNFILKKASKELKSDIFKAMNLDPYKRLEIEFKVCKEFEKILGSEIVPHIYYYDQKECVILMNSFDKARILKESLLNGDFMSWAFDKVSLLIGEAHSKTFNKFMDDTSLVNEATRDAELKTHYFDMAKFVGGSMSDNIIDLANRHKKDRAILLHGDLTPRNVLVSKKGIHLIDFELAHLGSPAYDLAHFLGDYFLFMWYKPELAPLVLDGVTRFVDNYFRKFKSYNIEKLEGDILKHSAVITLFRTYGMARTEFVKDDKSRQEILLITKKIINNNYNFSDLGRVLSFHINS